MPDNGAIMSILKESRSDNVDDSQSVIAETTHQEFKLKLRFTVYVFITVYLGAFGATLASYYIQHVTQMLVITITSFILVVGLFGVLRLIKRGRLQTSVKILLLITTLHLLAIQISLSGFGIFVLLSGVTLISVLGLLFYRDRKRFLFSLSFIFVLICIGIEQKPLFSRFDISLTPLADPAMSGVTITLLAILIALSIRFAQFSTIRTRLVVSFTATAIIPGLLTVGVILLDNAFGGTLIASAMSAVWLSMIMTTISICLALTGAIYFSNEISRPLNEMVAMADDVSNGDLNREVVINRVDEIGRTAIAFNGMTNQLRSVINELEERVQECTVVLKERAMQLEIASRISQQVASVRDVDTLIDVAVHQMQQNLGFDAVALYFLEDKRQKLVMKTYASDIRDFPNEISYKLESADDVVIAAAINQNNTQIIDDYAGQKQYSRLSTLPFVSSELALPLRIRNEVIGVLDIMSTQTSTFSSEDASYLQLLADQVALAIENATLLASVEERLQEIERLITNQSVTRWQEYVTQRQDTGFTYDGSRFTPLIEGGARQDDFDLRLPIESNRTELGHISFKLPENQTQNPDNLTLAQEIAREAGQAIESARLYTDTQEALQEVGVLYRAIQAIVFADTPEEVLSGFVRNLVPPAIEQCMILTRLHLFNSDTNAYARIEAAWEDGKLSPSLSGQIWDLGQIPAFSAEILVVNDIKSSTAMDALSVSTLLQKGYQSMMVVPLGTTEDVIGWLLMGTLQVPYVFTDRQIRLYRNFADQLAQALINIRLVQATRKRVKEEQLVREASERMREPVHMHNVLEVAADEIRRILDLDEVVIRLDIPETDQPVSYHE